VNYSDESLRASEEAAMQHRMEREERACSTKAAQDWSSVSSEEVTPCPGCIWTIVWALHLEMRGRWRDFGRGHDRRIGLRLVRHLRSYGYAARLIPSAQADSTIGNRP
jgi:hypothetical protein